MAEPDRPQLYLLTPVDPFDDGFGDRLAAVLDRVETACLRLRLAAADEAAIGRAADALREVAHARDVPLVIEAHWRLAERHGLDGVHLTDGARNVRAARKALGADAVVGAFCGATRHDGISAGEAGADYVAFGPVSPTPLGNGTTAPQELFAWWSEMIELPVVAEGAEGAEAVAAIAPVADFIALGNGIWQHDDPAAALKALLRDLG